MARLRDRLYRFRPAGAPGAAGAVGVPIRVDPADELAPLFDEVADTEARCAQLDQQAEHDAAELLDRARQEAAARDDAARRSAETERAAAAVRAREEAGAEVARITAAAATAAADLGRRAAAHHPETVGRVVEAVRSLLTLSHVDGPA